MTKSEYYSQIHDKMIPKEEVKEFCYGCETPLTEDDLQDDNTERTAAGNYYCHYDCFKDSNDR